MHYNLQWICDAAGVDDNMLYSFRRYDIISMPISLLLGYWLIFCLDFITGTRTSEKSRHGEQHNILTPCEVTLQ